ncbi:MAG: peptide chain release factor N(5)-glutamine methyltransferase [Paramuribaculum sp.]|nr:peptide chain release factor N(5)-glutamine methyltransferase [Paramuribaculum sp.]
MTLDQFCRQSRKRLDPLYGPGEAAMLLRIIFEHLKGWTQTDMIMHGSDEVSDFIAGKADAIIDRLLAHEPIQYIIGEARWYGMKFSVDRSTLIPRPETEQLVDLIVADASDATDLRVLDLCTGSGCIAIALARNLRFATVEAVDISAEALDVARRNADSLRAKVDFRHADVLAVKPEPDSFDIIVSNPPYIAEHERASMSANVLDYEPHTALFVPDSDPLRFYTAIARYAMTALKSGGSLYFELNPLYAERLQTEMEADGWLDVELRPDFRKVIRFLKARRP